MSLESLLMKEGKWWLLEDKKFYVVEEHYNAYYVKQTEDKYTSNVPYISMKAKIYFQFKLKIQVVRYWENVSLLYLNKFKNKISFKKQGVLCHVLYVSEDVSYCSNYNCFCRYCELIKQFNLWKALSTFSLSIPHSFPPNSGL